MKYTSETRQVKCGLAVIDYTLTRKPVKNINLRIKPDGKVLISANKRVPVSYIDNLIKDKQAYILRVLKNLKKSKNRNLPCPKNIKTVKG